MSTVIADLHNVVALTKLLAFLVRNCPVFVEVLSLTDDRHFGAGSLRFVVHSPAELFFAHALSSHIWQGTGRVSRFQPASAVCGHHTRLRQPITELIRVFADVVPVSDLFVELALPSLDTASCLRLLQPFEEGLILNGNLDQFAPSLFPVQALL
jgi:hypothetical protein